jgi:ABC-type Na+ efflux pump permease subunit
MTSALIKLTMSIILVVCFILIIVAGIMRSANKPKEAKKLISWVAITILLLWFAWVILRLINPNFFK